MRFAHSHLKSLSLGFAALAMALACIPAYGQPDAHYVPGTEGIKAATLPPEGFYFRDYNLFYFADRVNGSNGEEIRGANLNTLVYAQVPRLTYITDVKVFDGNIGFDAVWPLISTRTSVDTPQGKFDSSSLGFGDPLLETTLSWHLPQLDLALAVGEWMPAGDSEAPPSTKPGLGFWGTMFSAGATWYPDSAKTWSVSLLNRYEINSEDRDTHIVPGDAWTAEWGVANEIIQNVELGVVGYYQAKVTNDHGFGANTNFDHVVGVGPEVNIAFPEQMFFVSLRYCREVWAVNRAEGNTITLTLTKRF